MEGSVPIVGYGINASAGFEISGPLSERCFLVLPGGPGLPSKTMLQDYLMLKEIGTAVRIDPPSVGSSSPAGANFDYSPIAHARWYAAALDALGVDRCDVLGASFGGMAALALAAVRPELVSRCICVGTRIAGADLDDDLAAKHTAHVFNRYRSMPWFARAMDVFDNWQTYIMQAKSGSEIRELNKEILPLYSARADEPTVWDQIQQMGDTFDFDLATTVAFESGIYQTFDLRPLLSAVEAEVLFICGDLDWNMSPASQLQTATMLHHASVAVLPQCGHLVAIDRPTEFKHSVLDFFGRHRSS